MNTKSLVLVAVAVWAAMPQRAEACSCASTEQPTAFGQSVSVFEGRVASILSDESGVAQVVMRVVRTWKGANVEQIEVSTRTSGAACGYAFEQDRSYLVYTYRPDESDAQWVSLCSRTQPIGHEQAVADIAAMGEGITPASPESPESEILPDEVEREEEEEDDGVTAGQAPPRGGCASCSAGAPSRSDWPGAVVALVVFAMLWRRSR